MCALKEIEDTAIAKADAVIFPSDTLKSYVLDSRCRPRVLTVPHSFDPALYPESANFTFPAAAAGKTTLSFLGHSDSVRSLEPIVRAMNFCG
ncbi:hypothetical protein [Arcanobacterium hippocoleae]|uniref:hypothetical protein n=1 Tax=Arcanobacterium hippocoleae TaxID=149017 RepID=UPI00334043D4